MNTVVYVRCLAVHAGEARLLLEGHEFKPVRAGIGSGRIDISFEGRQPSMGIGNFVAAIENTLRRKCLEPIEVSAVLLNR
jgi:hypothetical protein